MTGLQRDRVPVLQAIASLARGRSGTWTWFGIYVLAGIIVVEVLFGLGWLYRQELGEAALWYLFPAAWHDAVRDLMERLFAERMRSILANAGLGLGLSVVGLLLFPLKEKLSAVYEAETVSDSHQSNPLPLWRQGLQETQLLLIYTAVQLFALWLGLQGSAPLAVLAVALGYWYLILAMAIDHAAPVLQRRGWTLGTIILNLLWRMPLSLHLLGAVFVLPGVACALLLMAPWMATQPLMVPVAVLAVQIVGMAGATLAGCTLGARLITHDAPPPIVLRGFVPGAAWSLLVIILTWQIIFFGWLLQALHQQSQILKCSYALDWSSVAVRLRGHPGDNHTIVAHLDLDMTVTNPTPFDVRIKDLVLLIESGDNVVARTRIDPFAVSAKDRAAVHLHLETEIDAQQAIKAKDDPARLDYALEIHPPLSNPLLLPLR